MIIYLFSDLFYMTNAVQALIFYFPALDFSSTALFSGKQDSCIISDTPISKPLEQLSPDELERWLVSINLGSITNKMKEHAETGEILAMCLEVEELYELGISKMQARVLFKKIMEAKANGVHLDAISDRSTMLELPRHNL